MLPRVIAMSFTVKSRATTSARSMTGSGISAACRRPSRFATRSFGHGSAVAKLFEPRRGGRGDTRLDAELVDVRGGRVHLVDAPRRVRL